MDFFVADLLVDDLSAGVEPGNLAAVSLRHADLHDRARVVRQPTREAWIDESGWAMSSCFYIFSTARKAILFFTDPCVQEEQKYLTVLHR